VVVEATWVAAHVALYPLVLARDAELAAFERLRVSDLPPLQRSLLIQDVDAVGTPVLIVHGPVDNRSVFTLLRRELRRAGHGRVTSMNCGVLTRDIRVAAEIVGAIVERICEETGYARIHVIGHSVGGLVARYYVQRLGGDARVDTLVTLATPHQGTAAAVLFPSRLVRQAAAGSDVIRELAGPVASCRTRFVAIAAELDELVLPPGHARLDHPDLPVENLTISGTGHLSLPVDGRAVAAAVGALRMIDSRGMSAAEAAAAAGHPASRMRAMSPGPAEAGTAAAGPPVSAAAAETAAAEAGTTAGTTGAAVEPEQDEDAPVADVAAAATDLAAMDVAAIAEPLVPLPRSGDPVAAHSPV
jgi:hypothetical protein